MKKGSEDWEEVGNHLYTTHSVLPGPLRYCNSLCWEEVQTSSFTFCLEAIRVSKE